MILSQRSRALVLLILLVLVATVSGCAMMDALRSYIHNPGTSRVLGNVGTALKTGAVVVSGTPLAPVAPILAALGMIAGGAASVLKPKKGVVNLPVEHPIDQPMVIPPGYKLIPAESKLPSLLNSRKTKTQYLAIMVAGAVGFAAIQWPEAVPENLAIAIMAVIGLVAKSNIDGIAKEDAAKHSANGNGSA